MNYFVTSISITYNGLGIAEISEKGKFWYIHGIGLFIAWNLFVSIGYISARFLKHYTWWIILHFLGGTIPAFFSFGIITAAIIKSKNIFKSYKKIKKNNVKNLLEPHFIIYMVIYFSQF